MNNAPRDGTEILALLCTGQDDQPIVVEIIWFEDGAWTGDYRFYDGPDGYPRSEPIGWAPLPAIDQSFIDLVTKPKPKALPKPAAVEATAAKPRKKKAAPKKAPAPASNSASDAFDPL